MLENEELDLVVLDELTYMLSYDYLSEHTVLKACGTVHGNKAWSSQGAVVVQPCKVLWIQCRRSKTLSTRMRQASKRVAALTIEG